MVGGLLAGLIFNTNYELSEDGGRCSNRRRAISPAGGDITHSDGPEFTQQARGAGHCHQL
jgi:hypothetical protein